MHELASGTPPESGEEAEGSVVCPFCGSRDTERISLFGSTSLTSQYHCRTCRSAFEQVKWGTVPRA